MTDWQNDFELKSEFTQGDFEKLEEALFSMPKALMLRRTQSAINHGAMLRAAIQAGWIVSPDTEVMKGESSGKRWFYSGKDVADLHPSIVRWLGNKVDEMYTSVQDEVPKKL